MQGEGGPHHGAGWSVWPAQMESREQNGAGQGRTRKRRRVSLVESLEGLQRGGVEGGAEHGVRTCGLSSRVGETLLLGSAHGGGDWGRDSTEGRAGLVSERQLQGQVGALSASWALLCSLGGRGEACGHSSRAAPLTCAGPTALGPETLAAI